MGKNSWSRDWTVGVRVWVDRRGETVLGEGRAELLAAIGKHRSITAAAKAIRMSYRRAWTLIQEVNEAAGEPLVEAAVGGLQGGGARLTSRGELAIDVYERLHASVQESAGAELRRLVATRGGEDRTSTIHAAAAISFQEALGQILAAFALARPAVRVRAVYGASNELADHALAGAPTDLFISAEGGEIERLQAAGRLAKGTRRVVAENGLAVIGSARSPSVTKLADLAGSRFKRVALADPACPLGRYSRACLEAAGIDDEVRAKALVVDNSRAVLAAIAGGAADVGLAFASDAARSSDCVTLLSVPRSKASAEYVAAVVKGAASKEARELLEFLETPAAVRLLQRCGFRAPSKKGR